MMNTPAPKRDLMKLLKEIAIIGAAVCAGYFFITQAHKQSATAPKAEQVVQSPTQSDTAVQTAQGGAVQRDDAAVGPETEISQDERNSRIKDILERRAVEVNAAGPVQFNQPIHGATDKPRIQTLPASQPAPAESLAPAKPVSSEQGGNSASANGSDVTSTLHPAPLVDQDAAASITAHRTVYLEKRKTEPGLQGIFKIGTHVDGAAMTPAETAEQIRQTLAKIPDEWTISYKAPNERARIYVFTDITCPFCAKLHNSMNEILAAGVSVHYLMYPRDMARDESKISPTAADMINIWCAPNQQEAINDAFHKYKPREARCDALPKDIVRIKPPVMDHYRIGDVFNVNGTPTIYASIGTHTVGFSDAAKLLAELGL